MKVTIQKIKAVEAIEGNYEHELVTVLSHKIKADIGEYRPGNWCLLEDNGTEKESGIHSILLLNEADKADEMVIGMSSITRQLQLGPYDDAVLIKVGVDVTTLVKKLIK